MNAADVMTYGNLTFQGVLSSVPLTEWQRSGVCGVWSVKDLVAHLGSYELLLVDVLGTFVSQAPTPLLDSYLEIGPMAFNDWEVAKRVTFTPDEALLEYENAHRQVMELLTALPPETLRQPGTLPWYGAEYALDDFIVYQYYGHIREHSAQIALFADRITHEKTVQRFNEALNAREVDGMMALMTDSCLFENTTPAPNGTPYEGQEAVRGFWTGFFRDAPEAEIKVEELIGTAEHCVMRWRYRWLNTQGQPGHIRGIDLYTLRNGVIAEKLSYVKG